MQATTLTDCRSFCLFLSINVSIPLHHGNIQYRITHRLARTHRRAAAHDLWTIRTRLVYSRGQIPLPHEVESHEGARHSAAPSFPHKARKGAGCAQSQADSASHLSS